MFSDKTKIAILSIFLLVSIIINLYLSLIDKFEINVFEKTSEVSKILYDFITSLDKKDVKNEDYLKYTDILLENGVKSTNIFKYKTFVHLTNLNSRGNLTSRAIDLEMTD